MKRNHTVTEKKDVSFPNGNEPGRGNSSPIYIYSQIQILLCSTGYKLAVIIVSLHKCVTFANTPIVLKDKLTDLLFKRVNSTKN